MLYLYPRDRFVTNLSGICLIQGEPLAGALWDFDRTNEARAQQFEPSIFSLLGLDL